MSEPQSNPSEDKEAPQFNHDCDRCTFLGISNGFDLYHCLQGGVHQMPTVIARFSSNGPDYMSGIPAAPYVPELGEALRRAKERGLRCG